MLRCAVLFCAVLTCVMLCRAVPQASRLCALLDASRMQAAFTSEQLMADLKDERDRAERLRAVRDDALMQRWAWG